MLRSLLSTSTVAAATAASGLAQTPAERGALHALRDTIEQTSDTGTLRALLQNPGIPAPASDLASLLRTAALQTRIGVLAKNRAPLDAAMRHLEKALRLEPTSAEAWYGLAESKLALHAGEYPAKEGPFQAIGVSYLAGAVHALVRATEADPSFLGAMLLLTNAVLHEPPAAQREALRALRAAAEGPLSHLPEVHLSRGILERELLDDHAAVAAFARYVDLGGDGGLGRLELARTLFALGQPTGAAPYYEGATTAWHGAIAQYRSDLAWIATDSELEGFDSSSPATRPGWLREFWEGRDDHAGRRRGERLAEHYRRVAHAMRTFRRIGPPPLGNNPGASLRRMTGQRIIRAGGVETEESLKQREIGRTAGELADHEVSSSEIYARLNAQTLLRAFHSGQMLLDDRGVIYVRHGEPQQRATYAGPQADANESWKYTTPQGTMIFHFVGTTAATELVEQLPLFAPLHASRGGLDPRYERLAFDLAKAKNLSVKQELIHADRERGKAAIRFGTSTDSHVLAFDGSFDPIVQVFGVSDGLDGDPQFLVVFAVPARAIDPERSPDGRLHVYPLAMRVIAEDSTSGTIVRRDTTRIFVSRTALKEGDYLSGQLRVPAAPGRYTVRVVLSDTAGTHGAAVGRADIPVPRIRSPELTMSDLVLGQEGGDQRWIAGADTVALNPLNAYPAGSSLEVFYQLGGLTPGATIRTSIEVRPRSDRNDRHRVAVSFDERIPAVRLGVHRSVALASLPPGEYLLSIRVAETAGRVRAVERRQVLTVVK